MNFARILFLSLMAIAIKAVASANDEDAGNSQATAARDCDKLYSRSYGKESVWKPLHHFRSIARQCGGMPRYNMLRAQLESFVGNHAEALDYWDRSYERRIDDRESTAIHEEKNLGFRVENAVSYIVDRSSKHRIVIVNERHHVSADRILTMALLEPLSRRGYRYLALEALWPGDDVNKRGYPSRDSGYYLNDVVFAEMLRVAISLGYEIVGYEIEEHQKDIEDGLSAQARRDYWQARNIIDRTLQEDADAKVLVHCGWAHVQEQITPSFQPMAHFLREISGIDPLTIDQTRLGERSSADFDGPLRTSVERLFPQIVYPLVLLTEKGKPLEIGKGVDVHVVFPRTIFRSGRPAWMNMLGKRHPATVAVPECTNAACIIEVRDRDRPDEVAYDRAEVSGQDSALFYLPANIGLELFVFATDGRLLAKRQLDIRRSWNSAPTQDVS
ncbi:hypothetical protein [Candidatus Foliamicus sp.]